MLQQLRLRGEPLDLDLTMRSGQIFRWNQENGCWIGWIKRSIVAMRKEDDRIYYRASPPLSSEVVSDFLGLDLDYLQIYSELPDDVITKRLTKKYWGLRILRQDPWECFFSYIISASMSIRAINAVLDRICGRSNSSSEMGPLPTPLEFIQMRRPKANYIGRKWGYLKELAKRVVCRQISFDEYRSQSYRDAWNKLVKGKAHVIGVGPKVADCTLLFSLDKLEAFPIDRWVLRGLGRFYPYILEAAKVDKAGRKPLTPKSYLLLSESSRRYFGRYGGVLQECLFLASRLNDASILQGGP